MVAPGVVSEIRPAKLSVRDLTISYEGKPILSNVNLTVAENEIFGIIGPAGAGKTSLVIEAARRGQRDLQKNAGDCSP